MVLGGKLLNGGEKTNNTEILDLSKANNSCNEPAEFPKVDGVEETTLGYYQGKVLYCSYLCHIYEPATNEWVATSDRISRQRYGSASSVIQGVWLISGGATVGVKTNTTEYWDGTEFHAGPDMPQPMNLHCQVTVSDNEVFIHTPSIDPNDPVGRTFLLDWNERKWTTLEAGTRTDNRGTCGKVKSSDNGWEIVVANRGTSSIFNLQSK